MKNKKRPFIILLAGMLIACLLCGCAESDAKAEYEKASALLTVRDYVAAAEAFSDVAESGYYVAEAYRGLGIAQLFQGSYAEAAISFSRAKLNLLDQSDAFRRDLEKYYAYCRLKMGKTEEAKELYTALLETQTEPEILYLRGRIYMLEGALEEADADFKAAAELSDDYNLFVNIYELYSEYKMDADGAEFLEMAAKKAQNSTSDHYGNAVIRYYLQDYEKAKNELIQALRAHTDDEKAVLLLGKTYLAMNDLPNARAMYREYADEPGCRAAAMNGLALCDMKEGLYESALEYIKEGIDTGDDTVMESLLYNEIIIYEHLMDWETARIRATAFAAQYPTSEAGQREYAFLSRNS